MARLYSERHIKTLRALEAGPANVRELAEMIGSRYEAVREIAKKYTASGAIRVVAAKVGRGYGETGEATRYALVDTSLADAMEAHNRAASGMPPELPHIFEPLPVRRIAPPGLEQEAIRNRTALERAWSML